MNDRTNRRTNQRTNEPTNGRTDERTNGRTDDRTDQRTDQRTDKQHPSLSRRPLRRKATSNKQASRQKESRTTVASKKLDDSRCGYVRLFFRLSRAIWTFPPLFFFAMSCGVRQGLVRFGSTGKRRNAKSLGKTIRLRAFHVLW